jgi:hypothetical protein
VPEPQKIKTVDLVPAPGGYYLDVLPEGGPLQRFKFTNESQITTFSSDARRIALMACGLEEKTLAAGDVQIDDLIPGIGGGRVYSRDVEKVTPEEVDLEELGGEPTHKIHLTFSGTEAVLSMPKSDGVSVVRKIS